LTSFYALASALGVLAAALLARPLWWPLVARAQPGLTGEVRGLARQLEQLGELHRAGTLTDAQYGESKALVERKVLEALSAPSDGAVQGAAPLRPSHALAFGTAAFMFAVAGGGYAWLGSPSNLGLGPGSGGSVLSRSGDTESDAPSGDAAVAPHALVPEQVAAMVDQLAERLKTRPDDGDGWLMLARSQVVLGKHAQAVDAFRQALRSRPDDANLLADYADALAMTQGRKLEGEPSRLVERALELDADNPKALALAGTAAFDRRDYKAAVRLWERLVQVERGDAGYLRQIRGGIAEARQLAGMPPADAAAPAVDGAPAPVVSSVSGMVELAAGLKDRVGPDDTVFVFARSVEGSRMPLAILRKRVRDLPLRFTLDDDLAMSPEAKLSGAARVVVGARVSKSGNAMPQSGDLQGLLGAVAVGSTGLKVEINQEVTR
jgi:cytochrome c-type biogenesis protein CcmH